MNSRRSSGPMPGDREQFLQLIDDKEELGALEGEQTA